MAAPPAPGGLTLLQEPLPLRLPTPVELLEKQRRKEELLQRVPLHLLEAAVAHGVAAGADDDFRGGLEESLRRRPEEGDEDLRGRYRVDLEVDGGVMVHGGLFFSGFEQQQPSMGRTKRAVRLMEEEEG